MSTTQARATLAKTREAHQAARAELQHIGAVIRAESPSIEATRAALEAARNRLQDVAAAHTLGEADKAALESARTELKQAEKDHETAQNAATNLATVAEGIKRRLQAAHEADSQAAAALRRAESMLILAELTEADAAYTRSAADLAEHAGRVLTCAAMLKVRDPSLVPAAASSCLSLPSLPTIGPMSAAAVVKRSKGRKHGIRAFLIEARHIGADPQTLEAQLLHVAPAAGVQLGNAPYTGEIL